MAYRRAKLKQRSLKRQMQKMGMDTEDIDGVIEVLIRKENEEIVIPAPQVQVTRLQDQIVYSVIGKGETRSRTSESPSEPEAAVNETDVQLVAQQAGVSSEEAKQALTDTGGDLARAILLLKSR